MRLSRIQIQNFRNFAFLDVALSGDVVVVGENGVGKSNFIQALRLVLDPSMPDTARQLGLSDFCETRDDPGPEDRISVTVEIQDFDGDMDVLAVLTDFRIPDDPDTVSLTYDLRPRPGLGRPPAADGDFEFTCFGGGDETKRFGHDLRRRLPLEVLPALRDAEGDLAAWRRSPLRPLVEEAFRTIDLADLNDVAAAVSAATDRLVGFDEIRTLEESVRAMATAMVGPGQDVRPRLGFAASEASRLQRGIRLLIDDGRRGIQDASLGGANVVFLTLKTLELRRAIEEGRRDHTFLAIEEPEAHLHPHMQRSVYRGFFEGTAVGGQGEAPLSILLTTHSPHVASVAPVSSLVLLRGEPGGGTTGRSVASLSLSSRDLDDLARYLDVTRAEMLFARGVILVEGDAERFLLPAFAEEMDVSLDQLGISVCSVAGTNFKPYAKFLTGLGIPFAVVTDWDPVKGSTHPLGYRRSVDLAAIVEASRPGGAPDALVEEIDRMDSYEDACNRCAEYGIFVNESTLEVDLFEGRFASAMLETLRERSWSAARVEQLAAWETDPTSLEPRALLKMVETIGKGRFAQRLSTRIEGLRPPRYLRDAITFVADRV